MSDFFKQYLTYGLFDLLVACVGLTAVGIVLLVTRRRSRVRGRILAAPDRIDLIGLGLLGLIWAGFVFYNRITGS